MDDKGDGLCGDRDAARGSRKRVCRERAGGLRVKPTRKENRGGGSRRGGDDEFRDTEGVIVDWGLTFEVLLSRTDRTFAWGPSEGRFRTISLSPSRTVQYDVFGAGAPVGT